MGFIKDLLNGISGAGYVKSIGTALVGATLALPAGYLATRPVNKDIEIVVEEGGYRLGIKGPERVRRGAEALYEIDYDAGRSLLQGPMILVSVDRKTGSLGDSEVYKRRFGLRQKDKLYSIGYKPKHPFQSLAESPQFEDTAKKLQNVIEGGADAFKTAGDALKSLGIEIPDLGEEFSREAYRRAPLWVFSGNRKETKEYRFENLNEGGELATFGAVRINQRVRIADHADRGELSVYGFPGANSGTFHIIAEGPQEPLVDEKKKEKPEFSLTVKSPDVVAPGQTYQFEAELSGESPLAGAVFGAGIDRHIGGVSRDKVKVEKLVSRSNGGRPEGTWIPAGNWNYDQLKDFIRPESWVKGGSDGRPAERRQKQTEGLRKKILSGGSHFNQSRTSMLADVIEGSPLFLFSDLTDSTGLMETDLSSEGGGREDYKGLRWTIPVSIHTDAAGSGKFVASAYIPGSRTALLREKEIEVKGKVPVTLNLCHGSGDRIDFDITRGLEENGNNIFIGETIEHKIALNVKRPIREVVFFLGADPELREIVADRIKIYQRVDGPTKGNWIESRAKELVLAQNNHDYKDKIRRHPEYEKIRMRVLAGDEKSGIQWNEDIGMRFSGTTENMIFFAMEQSRKWIYSDKIRLVGPIDTKTDRSEKGIFGMVWHAPVKILKDPEEIGLQAYVYIIHDSGNDTRFYVGLDK